MFHSRHYNSGASWGRSQQKSATQTSTGGLFCKTPRFTQGLVWNWVFWCKSLQERRLLPQQSGLDFHSCLWYGRRMKRAAFALALLLSTPASAHEWYEFECCHDDHCRPAKPGEWVETPQGWQSKGLLVPWSDERLRPSRDGQVHPCYGYDGELLCLYVPEGEV